jgi:hypothetical protein
VKVHPSSASGCLQTLAHRSAKDWSTSETDGGKIVEYRWTVVDEDLVSMSINGRVLTAR